MRTRESEEMYLETILLLKKRSSNVHAVNIAEELSYSRPSVSRAVNLLQKKNLITVAKSGEIAFTAEGKRRAEAVYEKHEAITRLFIQMGAEADVAEENACRIEHVISEEMFGVLKRFSDRLDGKEG